MSESIMQSILGGSVLLIISMIGYYIKTLTERVEKIVERISIVQDSQSEIEHNYLTRFDNVRKDIGETNNNINKLERRFEERFDELKGVLDNHFFYKHNEVVEDLNNVEHIIETIKNQVMENVQKWNESDQKFREEWLPILMFAKERMVYHSKRKDRKNGI